MLQFRYDYIVKKNRKRIRRERLEQSLTYKFQGSHQYKGVKMEMKPPESLFRATTYFNVVFDSPEFLYALC